MFGQMFVVKDAGEVVGLSNRPPPVGVGLTFCRPLAASPVKSGRNRHLYVSCLFRKVAFCERCPPTTSLRHCNINLHDT